MKNTGIKICILVILSLLFFSSRVNAKIYKATQYDATLYEIKQGVLNYMTTDLANNYWSGYIPYVDKDIVVGWKIKLPNTLFKKHVYYIRINSGNEGAGDGEFVDIMQNVNFIELDRKIDYSSLGTVLCFTIKVIDDTDVIFIPFSLTLDGSNIRFVLDKIEISNLNIAWNKHIYYGLNYFDIRNVIMLTILK